MRTFEFLAIFLSIIISLAFAHLLGGIAQIIRNGVKGFSLLLAQWIAFCLYPMRRLLVHNLAYA
jgi:uncharacterized membrane-anchored protein YitT (DUF2179 family)